MILDKIGQTLLRLVSGILYLFGYRYEIILDNHEIEIGFRKPTKKDKSNQRVYDKNHYVNGNLYISGKANPIKPSGETLDDNCKLISSDKYKKFMKMKILDDIARLSEGNMEIEGWKYIMIMVIFNSLVCGFLLVLLMGVL